MQPYKFNYPEQERIYHRLNTLVGLGAAAFYKDACRFMEMDDSLESTTHLVGHLLREIESSLRSVLKPIAKPTIKELELIKCPECRHKFPKPGQGQQPSHKDQIKAILKALEISDEDETAQIWLKLTGQQNDYALHSRAHRKDLAPPRTVDEEFRNFWKQIQLVLAVVLDKFETRASAIWGELDKLLIKTEPSKLSIVEQASDLKYFSSWFASGKLDNQWAIAKLVDVFNLLGTVHNSRNFFEHLKTLASTMPQDAIQLLCLMADSNQAGQWFLSHYSDRHRGILRAILQSEDEVAQKLARDLINRLLIPNLGDYRELIS